ncbi:ACP S-malonyltransferase [Mycoplasmatota bacterium]|nr:ACP S-malonyltransferase [Mycoplasmatota bacterium]
MKTLAILFSGQGSQYIGMGQDFYEKYDEVKDLYKKANQVLGYDLTKICFEENKLINQTQYTQPSVLVTSLGIYTAILKEMKINPKVLAGFSLGEYSALYASGIFDFEKIVYLVKQRANYMEKCATAYPGKMAAIIGMKQDVLTNICEEVAKTHGIVQIANYNCPNQLVIGGKKEAVEMVCAQAKEKGARRAVVLNVSGGFHTSLMSDAANEMYEEVIKTPYNKPAIDIIMNATADYLPFNQLPQLMKRQIESSVYFEDTIKKMIADGIDTFIEIGPGNVLSGFVRKIDRTKTVISIDKLSDLERVKSWI